MFILKGRTVSVLLQSESERDSTGAVAASRARDWFGILLASLAMALAGCYSGGRFGEEENKSCTGTSCPGTTQTQTLNERVFAWLQDWYLWYDQLPAINPNSYTSVAALVDAIRYRPTEYDRFSYVDTVANATAFFEEGVTLGYGFSLTRMPDNAIRITYVEPGSPAEVAGIARGDLVVLINGYTTAQLDAGEGGGYAQQLAVPLTDTRALFRITRGALTFDITLTAVSYRLVSIWRAELLTPTTAYLFIKQFIAPTKDEIRAVFAQPGWSAVTDLIIDMRYNGGGRISEANRLTSHVLGAPSSGQLYATLEFNRKQAASNFQFLLGDSEGGASLLRATSPRRVAIIVSSRTCSASEELIAAVRSFVVADNVFLVGPSNTCGKPYGFLPQAFQTTPGVDSPSDPVVNAINFRSIALNGTTDYITGFTPRCRLSDDLTRPLFDPNDALRVAARSAAEQGVCPTGTGEARVAPLSADSVPLPDPAPAGIRRLHSTW